MRGPEAPAPCLVLGTAGHVDHGKTALVRVLTGVDTDRLPEEKARGITIVLGFAPLELGPGLRVGVVDVPGHERFVRAMVAGAAGIDLVLLVVAADEGVMPQTREHVAICELLGIGRGVVALTKMDAAEGDVAELAAEEVRELLAAGPLAGSPVVPVSALTGAGLGELRDALRAAVLGAPARTPRCGAPRLAVDRLFAARGFGCVVTGTLVGAPLAVGDAVEVLPRGLRARVRGLQCFGEAVERVEPGSRCAVNLQGVELADLARGMLVTRPGALAPTLVFDAELRWLAGAPPLEERADVEVLAGAAHRRARLSPIGAGRIAPGEAGFARVHVEGEPLALLPGERFVVRGFSRSPGFGSTLGGGRVLDVAPPRRRRSDPAVARDLRVFAAGDAGAGVLARVERGGFAGASLGDLARETGLGEAEIAAHLAASAARVVAVGAEGWLAAQRMTELEARVLEATGAFHAREPLRPGMARGALAGVLPADAAAGALERVLERLAADGRLVVEEDRVRLPGFVPILGLEDERIAARLRADAMAAGLEPPTPREWSEELGVALPRLRELLAYLEREGTLIRAPGDVYFDRGAVDDLRGRVVTHFEGNESLDTPAYKKLIGTTRKWAVPLMELFDEEHLTARRGETRVLRRRPAP